MTKIWFAAMAVAGLATPAFAQSAAEALCSEYAEMDNAGKMAMVAELQSLNSESASSQEVTSAEIEEKLAANCTEHPEMLLIEVIQE